MKRVEKSGFTLIELLVVVSIIALLLSILMPGLQMAKEKARRIVCRSNIRSVMQADQIYALDNEYYVPIVNGWSPNNWTWYQNPELRANIGIDLAGNEKEARRAGFEVKNNATLPDEMKCPTDKRKVGSGLYVNEGTGTVLGMSYGFNVMSIMPESGSGWYYMMGGVKGGIHALKMTQVSSPGTKFRMLDCSDWIVDRDRANYTQYWDVDQDNIEDPGRWHKVAYRHNEGANIGYYDGHAESLAKEKIYKGDPEKDNPKHLKVKNNQWWLPKRNQEYFPKPWR